MFLLIYQRKNDSMCFFFLEDLKTFKREKYIGEKSWVQGFQKPSSNIIFSIGRKYSFDFFIERLRYYMYTLLIKLT